MYRSPQGIRTLLCLSLFFHVVWLVVALFLFLGGPFGTARPTVWQWARNILCTNCSNSYDAINMASQLGRLDFASLSLTIVATVLAIGAFAGFFLIRAAAIHAASEEAANHVSDKLADLLTTEIIADAILNNDRIRLSLSTALRANDMREGQLDEQTANDIANAMSGGKYDA